METTSVFRTTIAAPSSGMKIWISAIPVLFISGILKAGDQLSSLTAIDTLGKDSLASDSLNAVRSAGSTSFEDNPVLKYSAMALGIIAVVAFALFTSMRKSKPNPNQNIGYRKNPPGHQRK